MHGVKDIFPLNADIHAKPFAFPVERRGNLGKGRGSVRKIDEHDHGEHSAEDCLRDIQNVDVDAGEGNADSRDDAHAVVADDGDDGMHGKRSSNPLYIVSFQ